MRNSIYLLFALSFNIAFSQIEKNDHTFLNKIDFKNKISESDFLIKNEPKNLFPEIVNLKIKDIKNNSEGKFSLNDSNKKHFIADEKNTTVTIFDQKKNTNTTITLSVKKEFIEKIIQKKIAKEIQEYMMLHEALTFSDKNIDVYHSYVELENKLIVSHSIYKDIEIQIGKDIYPYLNKMLKTELDKTLQNSLNLLAINF
tara:strand:- start:8972 stop:9571 length:600 start_codon:yes stop_codon:yes gene_type:complete